MSLVRGFAPDQFRNNILGTIGPIPVTCTVPATAAGGVGNVAATLPNNPNTGAAYTAAQLGLLPTDILLAFCVTAAGQIAGVEYGATINSAGALNIVQSNGTGGALTSQALSFVIVGLRFNAAA